MEEARPISEKQQISSSPISTEGTKEANGFSSTIHEVDHDGYNASGHPDQLKRHYGLLAICGAALSIDNAWVAFAGSLQVAIANGGPCGILYELLTACFIYAFINASIAEVTRAHARTRGGVFHWASVTPGRRWGRSIGFFAGWLNYFGWIFDLASIAYIPANVAVQIYSIYHPDAVLDAWTTYVAFVVVVLVCTAVVIFLNPILPMLQHVGTFLVLAGGIITIIVVAAMPEQHASTASVFTDFNNTTGWSGGVAFLTGVLNGAFAVGTPDSVSHLGEEMPYPRRDLPRAIMAQITLGTLYAFCFGIAIFYGINDLDAVVGSTGTFPLGEIYLQATGSNAAAVGLLFIVLFSILVCTISTVLTVSRILWSLARDDVVPFPRFFARVNTRLSCPVPAVLLSVVLVLGFGAISLGSKTAFNDLVGSFIILTTISYLLAILPHFLSGRKNVPRGPFWMGTAGFAVNAVACVLIVFFNIFFCFPYAYPVADPSLMNYNSVILVGCTAIAAFWWVVYGWRHYRGPRLPHLDEAGHQISAKI